MNTDIIFVGRVLDNVHGFIEYTETEECIMDTLLFKRLQSIKQLSIVNWVFPGSEHTRYIHSLGVMHIADRIAVKLGLPDEERKIVRLAGLLHDIGHYPLSHVGELPYKDSLECFPEEDYCKKINERTKLRIENLRDKHSCEYMKRRNAYHHEQIGAEIVLHNDEIKRLVINECGPNGPEMIADMIVGNVERTDPLLVQILHSELDADGIDYLMRDAMFSGTSFGTFELDQLIRCMEVGIKNNKRILCINPKGIAAADQYLINKFFSYSQVVCNKHVCVTEWMAEQIVTWMQQYDLFFPEAPELKRWVKSDEASSEYLGFTDNLFWASLKEILSKNSKRNVPGFISSFCEKLLHHTELEFVDGSEVKIVSDNEQSIIEKIMRSQVFFHMGESEDCVGILLIRPMSRQIPYKDFSELLDEKIKKEKSEENGESITEEKRAEYEERLFMECISVKENDEIHLLCDDECSLMRTLYSSKLAVLRLYKYE